MENLEELCLEKLCLEKLNKILSKFDLKIETVHSASISVCQYRLIDNSNLPETDYSDWLGLWSSISNILMHHNSIFECLYSYSKIEVNSNIYQRYLKAYNAIKHLENICCLEEFLIKCDLTGI